MKWSWLILRHHPDIHIRQSRKPSFRSISNTAGIRNEYLMKKRLIGFFFLCRKTVQEEPTKLEILLADRYDVTHSCKGVRKHKVSIRS